MEDYVHHVKEAEDAVIVVEADISIISPGKKLNYIPIVLFA
jgi:GTP:adenosylcobinamide-phosphate guanylyltransferase